MREFLLTCACLGALVLPAAGGDERPVPVRIASGVSGHIHPAACVTERGTVVVIFSQADFKDLRVTRSADSGKTWSTPVPFPHTAKLAIYPGALTALRDGRVVHAWNRWYQDEAGKKSRYVEFSLSGDDGQTWDAPRSLARNPKAESIVRHSIVELGDAAWLFSLSDRTIVHDPRAETEAPFADGRTHGLTPIVRTSRGTFVSGAGLRSADGGKSWQQVTPFPDIRANGWRFDLAALRNGWLLASEVQGPGVGGESWRFVVSRDDGQSWELSGAREFYRPGRPIGGRACPKTVQLDEQTLGTAYYDTDAGQPGGPGVFFLRTPLRELAKAMDF
jgi:hypothetical protein